MEKTAAFRFVANAALIATFLWGAQHVLRQKSSGDTASQESQPENMSQVYRPPGFDGNENPRTRLRPPIWKGGPMSTIKRFLLSSALGLTLVGAASLPNPTLHGFVSEAQAEELIKCQLKCGVRSTIGGTCEVYCEVVCTF